MSSSSFSLDVLSLSKQLATSWTSWKLGPQFHDVEFLNNIINSYDKFEKKVLLRIMLSLLGLEGEVLKRNEGSIKRFLRRAVSDKDEWIQVTAGIIHSKIFVGIAGEVDAIEKIAKDTCDATVTHIIDQIRNSTAETSMSDLCDDSFYFQPKEFRFLTPEVLVDEGAIMKAPENMHFKYVGKRRTFYNFDKEAIPRGNKPIQGDSSQLEITSNRTNSGVTASSSTARSFALPSKKTTSSLLSSSVKGEAKKLERMSIEMINDISKKRKEEEKKRESTTTTSVGAKKAKIFQTTNVTGTSNRDVETWSSKSPGNVNKIL